ncbi:MAG TPA: ATP-binding protein [Candidatus Angelobacter sp.]|nr:ATP-binding protein [Candidatus Angelobacter sp.]
MSAVDVPLKTIFESVPDLYLVLTPDFTIVEVSNEYLRATMTKREQVIGRKIFEVFPDNPADADATGVRNLNASLARVLQTRAPDTMTVQKYDIRGPEEGLFVERYWSPRNVPVVGKDGEVLYIIHRVEDVTDFVQLHQTNVEERRNAEQLRERAAQMEMEIIRRSKELAQANEHLRATVIELESFCYSLSHDMRAPLRAIQSFSQLVLDNCSQKIGGEYADHLKKVVSAARRMDRLILDVLAFSRISGQRITIEPLDAEKLIHDIIDERPELQFPNAEIKIESPLPPMLGHEASLTQCVSNYLENAVKYVAPGVTPQVRIYSEAVGNDVRLCFQDNGIGINPEGQRRLFRMFQRIEGPGQYEGTGIGLAIVRKSVERMGGQAGVESEPDKGSRFWLRLPRA